MSRSLLLGLSLLLHLATSAQESDIRTFLPGLISSEVIEYYATFSTDGNTVYFVRRHAAWADFNDKTPGHIYQSQKTDGAWQTPEVAPFSGTYADSAPFISHDGKYFFFTSKRSHSGKTGSGSDIWMMEKKDGHWATPRALDNSVNSEGTEYSPVLTKSGRLYFASTRPGGLGQGDVYVCDFNGTGCANLQNLGPAINTPTGEWNVFVDPDETFMIFEASGRIPAKDFGDLYISFRKNGQWQKAVYLDELNSTGSDLAVRLGPEGKYLYFAQSEGTNVDIKYVPVEVIEKYR